MEWVLSFALESSNFHVDLNNFYLNYLPNLIGVLHFDDAARMTQKHK